MGREFLLPRNRSYLYSIVFLALLSIVTAQDTVLDLPLGDRAKERMVEASSTCGLTGPETYCMFLGISQPASESLAPKCAMDTCDNTCPHGDTSPNPILLEQDSILSSIASDTPAPGQSASSLLFSGETDSFISHSSIPVVQDNTGFSFSSWIRVDSGNFNGIILSRGNDNIDSEELFHIRVSGTSLYISYIPLTSETASEFIIPSPVIVSNEWYHISVAIYQEDVSVYVNGVIQYATSLIADIKGPAGILYLGRGVNGSNSFTGNLDVPAYYTQAITQREAYAVYSGSLSFLHLSPNCRCPPSHPVVSPTNPSLCTQHPGLTTDRGSVNRLNTDTHPPSYSNDNFTNSYWLSAPTDRMVNVTYVLTDKLIEVLFFLAVFNSPRPQSLVLLKSTDHGNTFTPLQYYSSDCMGDFGLVANAEITSPSDAICVDTFSIQSPLSASTLSLDLFNPNRPGYSSFNTNLEFREFTTANQIRLSFRNYFTTSTTDQHLYYALSTVTVAARCKCNGHADSCIYSSTSSDCQCQHNTQGDLCDECLPLFNSKPWLYGIPCVACTCNNHADDCMYDETLDSNPSDRNAEGGGVCIACKDNTQGRYCSECIDTFYRDVNKQIEDTDVCVSCNCDSRGITDEGLCSLIANNNPQCNCKQNVEGPTCSVCKTGYFSLDVTDSDGCTDCECNKAGTELESTACHADSGQCVCKSNVDGVKCDACKSGFTRLTSTNAHGCVACACNQIGSVGDNCDQITSNCECKPGVGATRCNTCLSGYHSFSTTGCQACQCGDGSMSEICDVTNGLCECKLNVEGNNCDVCKNGFFNLMPFNEDGCISCQCDQSGTVLDSQLCDTLSGDCNCKMNVQGTNCNDCLPGFFSLQESNSEGCESCQCNEFGTDTAGDICDMVTGECECIEPAMGAKCDSCSTGHFLSSDPSTLCEACSCNSITAFNQDCNSTTGQCLCIDGLELGIGGRTCEECIDGFFSFSTTGCSPCNCNVAGSESITCDKDTGACVCKKNVEGISCEFCKDGFGFLSENDEFGCSSVPSGLAPPTLQIISSTSIMITWSPPSSESAILFYEVFRNNTIIQQTTDLQYTDTHLSPNTIYTYTITATNNAGLIESDGTTDRTLEDAPTGVSAVTLTNVQARSLQASWSVPTQPNGVITVYNIFVSSVGGDEVAFSGLTLNTAISNLNPFTEYSFTLQVCTNSGCTNSSTSTATTLQAVPQQVSTPVASSVISDSLQLSWSPPAQPNGDVISYEVFQRESPFTGTGVSIASLTGSELSVSVTNLNAFTEYEFAVLASTIIGGTLSEFLRITTLEAVPTGIQDPILTVQGPTSLQITWQSPTTPNAASISYNIIRTSPLPMLDIVTTSTTGSFILSNLQPFSMYSFLLLVCNVAGCGNSSVVTITTDEQSPSGQSPPIIVSTYPNNISLEWNPPLTPNGIITSYTLSRRLPSLTLSSQPIHEKGIRFHGAGYIRFPTGTFNPGFATTITLRIRTFSTDGLVMLLSTTIMSDYIAISFNSTTVQFAFDSGTNSLTNILALNVAINDGAWHDISATRIGNQGELRIDSSMSVDNEVSGFDNDIAQSSIAFIGGVDSDFVFPDSFPVLSEHSFAGCVRDMEFNSEFVDFDSIDDSKQVDLSLAGCPVDIEQGTHYTGAGFAKFDTSNVDINGESFEISFEFNTLESTSIVFSLGLDSVTQSSDYILFSISDGLPITDFQISGVKNSIFFIETVINVCDRNWHYFSLEKTPTQISMVVDGDSNSIPLTTIFQMDTLYLGGLDVLSPFYTKLEAESLLAPNFGGCIRGLQVNNIELDYTYASGIWNVDVDGCPAVSIGGCTAASINDISSGDVLSYTDTGLMAFREYYYRVSSQNTAGSATSNWQRANTQQGVPSPPSNLQLTALGSTSIQVRWDVPTTINGVVDLYLITTLFNGNSLSEESVPDTQLQFIIQNLSPFTSYTISLYVQLTTGTVSDSVTDIATTQEDVPSDVTPPTIVSTTSRDATVTWEPPLQPNGIITSYSILSLSPTQSTLYVGNSIVFTATLLNLLPYTEYEIILRACTVVGCSDSQSVLFITGEDIPEGLNPPSLIVLDSRRVLVQWITPSLPNGVITSYTVLYALSTDPTSVITAGTVNTTVLEFTVSGLQPATEYQFSIQATNSIGSVTSDVTTNSTLHGVPEEISPPSVSVVTSVSLSVVWQVPNLPNGDIINYKLLIDQNEVFEGLVLQTTVPDLQPFTSYNLRIQACTIIGCGTSDSTITSTLEAPPEGITTPTLISRTSTTLTIRIFPISNPNGLVTYTLYAVGVFNASINQEVLMVVYSSVDSGDVVIMDLLPFNSYTVYLDVNNTVGGVRSEEIVFDTLGTVPEGLSAPTLINSTSTTLTVIWSPPSFPNGDIHTYLLYGESNGILSGPVSIAATDDLVGTLTNLRPFTVYTVFVIAVNQYGNTTSEVALLTTLESVPEDQPAPTISDVQSRSVQLSWMPPSTPNGQLIQYNIIQNGVVISTVSSATLEGTISLLTPFAQYSFAVEACTAVGCFRSDDVIVTTLEDAPENLSPPSLESNTSTSVIIRWDAPLSPNGVLQLYFVERLLPPAATAIRIATFDANATLVYIDGDDNVLTPFLFVFYRVVAVNSAGSTASSYANITTLQAPPSSIEPPTLTLIQPTSVQIIWLEPTTPNGIITEYILKYQPTDFPNLLIIVPLHSSLTGFALHNLSPYQNYSISITACTFGGCTESDVVVIQTGQVLSSGFSEINVEIVSATQLVITWLVPTMPNGLIAYYTLSRREDGEDYVQISQGLFLSYNDSSLLPFHEYQYSLEVTNGAGSIAYGNTSLIQTLADTPLAGVTLNASTTTSSIILLEWITPSIDVVRGDVVNFEVIGYQVGSEQVVTSFSNGTGNMFSVTGLNPSITYAFQVILFNGVGYALSNIAEATTLDGAPKGVFPPILTVIDSTAIQVEWVEPGQPNGVIVSYNIILDGISIHTDNISGVFLAMGLLPYTVYTFELVACTRFECTQSNSSSIRTLQSPPTGFDSPNVSDIQHDSFFANWAAPTVTNGDITSYSLYLRYVIPCSQSTDQDTCDYVECPLGQSSCGYQCYTASTHVCCQDTLYLQADNHACCRDNYIERLSASDVCCGGSFYTLQSDYACCGGLYQYVAPGDICCDDGNTVNVGSGDACCGTTAYTDNDNFMCCGGNVVSQHINTMCCGDTVVSTVDTVCCNGVTYSSLAGYVCCDTRYEPDNVTLCCAAGNGVERVISYTSPANKSIADEKCCDVMAIPSQLSCCYNRGYNPQLETCSDRSTSTGANCGTGVTCPNAQSGTAYCNRCDFPFSTHTCDSIDLLNSNTQICYQTTAVFTGFDLSYRATGLTPFTTYLVYVGVSNAAGETISPEVSIRTSEFMPANIDPPILTVLSATEILIEWTTPTQPNGIIIGYTVYRDDQEIATVNDSTQYTDLNLIPFTTYNYMVSACTIIGCTISDAVTTSTFESTPFGLAVPIATQITPNSIELIWMSPVFPNGIIMNYIIYDSSGLIVFTGLALATTITGLNAFTQYTYTLQACNSFDCVLSLPTTFTTSEIPPTTIEPPILTIIRFDELEIRWSPPSSPNGIIQYYLLRKDDVIILNTTFLVYIDTDIFASTTYRYTIEAFNNVGSVISGAASVSTPDSTPSGLNPPILTPVNATAVLLEWIPPTLPNGDIIQYDLYQDNLNFITITDTIQLSYTRTGLIPFTQYSFRVSACTRSGCALSNAALITTPEAPPTGIDPVLLLALSSSSLRVSWNPPAVLNGILIGYELLQTTANEPPLQIPVPPEFNTIDIDNLNAFRLYTYTVKARNSAGSVTSAEASVRTLEALPMLFAAPIVSAVAARSLILTWDEPAQPNGIKIIYYIYARIITTPLNPIPMNRIPVLLLTVNGSTTTTQLQDLEPGSSYEFRIAANNSIGQVITTWVPATTAEDNPELLQLIMYTADPSGSSLDLSWNEPLKPNGVISEYLIYLGVNPIFRGVSNSFTYRLLTPFTDYELYLQACTSAGCTNGDLQVLTTAEISPENQNAPFLETLGSSSIRITWQLPLNPNGNIIRFLIHRIDPDNTLSQIHTVLNVSLRNFIDTGLLPYSFYSYAITAENSVGFTQSDFNAQQTDEGVPEGIGAPIVQAVLATEMRIQWSAPSSPNGVITNYDVIRDGNTIVSLSNAFVYFDRNLDPFTYYSYQITACNSRGGCVTSGPTVERTLESIPEGVIAPSLTAVSFSEVEVRWDPPTKPNGVIQSYMLAVDDVNQPNTITPFIFTQTNLLPYTIYRIAIIACTSIGCSVGPTSNILTLEYIPFGQPAPVVSVTSSKSTLVTWQVPSMPNGVIIGYDVIRNGSVVLFTNSTQDRLFADTNLRPAKTYVYSIRAYTSIGASDPSPGTIITTSPDAPELLDTPTLTPLTSTSFKAEWSAPQIPNGAITRYDLLVDNTVVFTGLQFEYIVTGLQPFTMYNVIIRACTTTCTDSQIATVTTNSDTPIGQPVPTLTALQGSAVLIQWEAPDMPNGIITEYRVFRRELFNVNGQTTFSDEILVAIVYSELFTIDNSTDLKLYTDYQYKVVAINTVGQAVSEWGNVRTVEGIPMDVVPPELLSSSHTSITLLIIPPETPNGIITSYIVYRDGVQVAELTGTENTTTITNLLPYTIYYINVTACTVTGCATSDSAALRTGEYTPEGVTAPVANVISAREILFTWIIPSKPNGIITSYSILAQTVCPQPTQPHINPGSCQYGTTTTVYTGAGDLLSGTAQGLTPYATYQFFLVAANSHSAQQSPPSIFYTTDSAEPEVRDTLSVRRLCNTVTIDWSNVFHLNGLLKNFEFLVNSEVLDSTIAITKTVEDLTYGAPYEFKVKAITSVGSVEQANFVLIESAPHCVDPSMTTPSLTPNVTATPTTPVSVSSLVAIVLIIVVIIFLAVLFLCLLVFCIVILSSRKEREKYRTQSRTPLLAATNSKLDDPLSDLTLQESLMLENRSNTLDLSSRSRQASIANSSLSYGNSIRTPPSARYSPRLTQLDASKLMQSSDVDFSHDESGFRDTRL